MDAVIAAGDRSTAAAGRATLDAGGNAVDAVVAASFAAFFAEPLLAGAGGAGLLVAARPGEEPVAIDFFSAAPGLGGEPEALDFAAVEVDFGPASQTFHVGRGSVAAPLALPGLLEAARHLGRLELPRLLAPAIALGRRGAILSAQTARVYRLLWSIQERSPEALALAGGRPPSEGTRLTNPDLADLLDEIARRGAIPPRWDEAVLECASPARGGRLSAEDLAAAAPRIGPPRTLALGDWTVVTSPRLGGALVLTISEALARRPAGLDPVDDALSLARASRAGHSARGSALGLGSTTHVSALDADGGVAAVTLTNGEGCGHVAPGTGAQLNNFLGEEDLNAGGFHRHAPGAPLPTMIAPTLALRDGAPVLALGSGGSNRIRSVVAQVLDRVSRGSSLRAAIDAPRVHAEADDVWLELADRARPDEVQRALATEFARVHPFPGRAFFFGGVHAVAIEDGHSVGAADARRGGAVERSVSPRRG